MKVPMNEYENGLLDDCMLLLRMGNIYRKDGKELTLEKLYNDLLSSPTLQYLFVGWVHHARKMGG